MFDKSLYFHALDYAKRVHWNQTRGNGDPYLLHLMRVSTTVLQFCPQNFAALRDKMGVVALLHDSIEDAQENKLDPQVVAQVIQTEYGDFVLSVVKELTQDGSLPKKERREKMIEHCRSMSQQAQVVKLADRLDNVSEMKGMSTKFIERYLDETPRMLESMNGACPELEAKIQAVLAEYK